MHIGTGMLKRRYNYLADPLRLLRSGLRFLPKGIERIVVFHGDELRLLFKLLQASPQQFYGRCRARLALNTQMDVLLGRMDHAIPRIVETILEIAEGN